MTGRIGKYITQTVSGEPFKAHVPPELPVDPPIVMEKIYPFLEKATLAIAELSGLTKAIPNKSLFLYMYVRKEALLSSQIEGTQSSFSDLMLFEQHLQPEINLDDVNEVSNYVKALHHGLERIEGGFPLSLRLLKEVHQVLLSGGRGMTKQPGEFRRSQNWIGGTRPGNALYVPPPVNMLDDCLANLEQFLHDNSLPTIIKAGIAHVQFESIHPFLDGNGRLGRLLIILLFCVDGILDEPILYISLFLKQNRRVYYNLLTQVREHGAWEVWLEFFLNGLFDTAKQAILAIQEINGLFHDHLAIIDTMGRSRITCAKVFEYLQMLPQVTVSGVASALSVSLPTARDALNNMVEVGILEEISGKVRNKVYVYRQYLDILEEGTEPFQRR
ncbi:MAG: cell filamentation protein Fic [Legionellales bacterium]|nr:cell filamentation protein Fic [Legionellales bacterium]|tara:strand:+ start:39100 stop:40260 length:1161 start_codon:yes stop_codon:yes gene_type:complete